MFKSVSNISAVDNENDANNMMTLSMTITLKKKKFMIVQAYFYFCQMRLK